MCVLTEMCSATSWQGALAGTLRSWSWNSISLYDQHGAGTFFIGDFCLCLLYRFLMKMTFIPMIFPILRDDSPIIDDILPLLEMTTLQSIFIILTH